MFGYFVGLCMHICPDITWLVVCFGVVALVLIAMVCLVLCLVVGWVLFCLIVDCFCLFRYLG